MISECEDGTGWAPIRSIYYDAYANPDAIDLGPYQYQCYVEHGVLNGEYASYEEFDRAWNDPNRDQPVFKVDRRSQDVVEKCTSDPLHNISNSPLGR